MKIELDMDMDMNLTVIRVDTSDILLTNYKTNTKRLTLVN